ncbi:MAG: hypothetical protein GXP55_24975 [Deltaproteobacteria bacterium]|nr:hypothetical protein [Deltaproteobacteria bacterium]
MRVLAFSLFLLLSLNTHAAAQRARPSEANVTEARALFIAGQAAVDSERWADAVDSFRRAYLLVHAPSALYNVAYALRALGRHRESRDAFEQLLTEHDNLSEQLLTDSRRYLEEERGRVAVLMLMGLDPDSTYTVRLDGTGRSDDGQRPLLVEADPGSHTLTVRAPGVDQPFVWEGEVTEGAHVRVPLHFEEPATGAEDGPEESHGGVLRSPIFWTIVGVLVVGGAVSAGVMLNRGDTVSPQSDRVYNL